MMTIRFVAPDASSSNMKIRVIFTVTFFLVIFLFSCRPAGDRASGGDHLFLTADPQSIGFNGTSTLTVTGTDANGVPLPDGTLVSFEVDLAGNVSPRNVRLLNGTATSTYHATSTSGNITITAFSGSVDATATITVADNVEENVFVSANPATFGSGGGTSLITAVVTDTSGKPIENLGVTFSTTAGTLQSGGATIDTNSGGVATDTLVTTEPATVTVTTDDGFSGETSVNVGAGRIVCHMTVSNSSPKVGEAITFLDTSEDPGGLIARYHWDFGDTASVDGKNVQHAYSAANTYSVVHSVVDSQGNTTTCDPFPIVVTQ